MSFREGRIDNKGYVINGIFIPHIQITQNKDNKFVINGKTLTSQPSFPQQKVAKFISNRAKKDTLKDWNNFFYSDGWSKETLEENLEDVDNYNDINTYLIRDMEFKVNRSVAGKRYKNLEDLYGDNPT